VISPAPRVVHNYSHIHFPELSNAADSSGQFGIENAIYLRKLESLSKNVSTLLGDDFFSNLRNTSEIQSNAAILNEGADTGSINTNTASSTKSDVVADDKDCWITPPAQKKKNSVNNENFLLRVDGTFPSRSRPGQQIELGPDFKRRSTISKKMPHVMHQPRAARGTSE
jgi:hypothetical protein